jgi:site-specific DNA-methyltransferase (adenine-specific)
MKTFTPHPIASIFPEMPEGEVSRLADDIRAHGLREPVWLYEGRLLDGRNRYRACSKLGLDCPTREYTGDRLGAVAFVWSMNHERRHLNSSQAAIAEAKRTKFLAEYAAEVEKMKVEARTKQDRTKHQERDAKGRLRPAREIIPAVDKETARVDARRAKAAGTNRKYLEAAEDLIEKHPQQAQAVERGEKTIPQVRRELKAEERKSALQAALNDVRQSDFGSLAQVRCCRMEELLDSLRGLDAIITAPPYSEQYLPLYAELARRAKKALKPDGVLAVLCGQSYLPRLLADMSAHMPYRWTFAYLTPGGQAVQVWNRKVITFWKPVLVFGGSADWAGDVVQSKPNDNDKLFHEWGQSVSGFLDLVQRLTQPGQRVCDPFMGAGTTGVACLLSGRRFVGCDVDEQLARTSQARMAQAHRQEAPQCPK